MLQHVYFFIGKSDSVRMLPLRELDSFFCVYRKWLPFDWSLPLSGIFRRVAQCITVLLNLPTLPWGNLN